MNARCLQRNPSFDGDKQWWPVSQDPLDLSCSQSFTVRPRGEVLTEWLWQAANECMAKLMIFCLGPTTCAHAFLLERTERPLCAGSTAALFEAKLGQ